MGSDPQYASYPDLLLAQHIFTLRQPQLSSAHETARDILTTSIEERSQASLYQYLAHPSDGILGDKLKWDEKYYDALKKKNDDELEEYDKELKEAKDKAGESEIVEAMGKKAEFWARVVDKVRVRRRLTEMGLWRVGTVRRFLAADFVHRRKHWPPTRNCSLRRRLPVLR